ncbi:MAG: hypothetical protein R3E01_05370 [Pirellulaceae bacterium]|nr:hypothetical protein [Planctomycetales bacterium]
MKCSNWLCRSVLMICVVLASQSMAHAIDLNWVGGATGEWNDVAAWNDGIGPIDWFTSAGRTNGYEGADPLNAVIAGGSVVTYDSRQWGDFRMNQNGTLTIQDGATWQQVITEDPNNGNNWTRMNPSELNIDGGTFRRVGASSGEIAEANGSSVTEFYPIGGWFALGGLSGSASDQVTNVNITNGGQLINEGQLLLGYPTTNNTNISVSININDGTMDLTGGKWSSESDLNLPDSSPGAGDLLIWDFYSLDTPEKPTYAINFTGPGQIITDYGIQNPIDSNNDNMYPNLGEKLTWEELWNRGILQANGQSGKDGLTFGDYFSTSGTFDGENYTLTSKVGTVTPLLGDYNKNGEVDAADYTIWKDNFGSTTSLDADGNANGEVDAADYTVWKDNFGATAGAAASVSSVPEPATGVLSLLSLLALAALRRR